ncbi:MAG: hypothetical protein JJU31_12330 [Wenzhouxiangella sp.]|nr:hypothetical protein [Wenzhouxiangella sp.]MCH8479534.1 hypothetical protein [Wenzhouxiangella sp.]TVR97679.1 MAG: hypothetical protein EA418_02710 [Wenzhouxiangellaceae bacterium]
MSLRGLSLLLAGLLAAPALAADRYLVESSLWLDGQLAGTPTLIVEADEPASLERGGEVGFRLTLMVEPVLDELVPQDILWLHVTIEQLGDEGWEELADSMLGAREGEPTTLSVVEAGQEATPESASLFLEARISRLRPADQPN